MKHIKGFTIIETLIAITILMIAVAGPLTIVTNSLNASIYARDQVVATYLAQDGMEFLKNKRDYNLLRGLPFLNDIADPTEANNRCFVGTSATNYCSIDTIISTATSYTSCASSTNCGRLYLNTDIASNLEGFFTHSGSGKITPFHRYYTLYKKSEYEYRIEMIVTWKNGTYSNTVSLKSSIFNTPR